MLIVKALLTDCLLWIYLCITSYKIIYQHIIINQRYQVFSWSPILIISSIGFALGIFFFLIPNTSIGKIFFQKHKINLFIKSLIFIFLIQTLLTGLIISQVSLSELLSSSGIAGAKNILKALLSPNFSLFTVGVIAAVETLYMALMATFFAIPFAFIISFLGAKNIMSKGVSALIIYTLIRIILNFIRAVEPLVWAIILSVWVGIGPFAGMLALWLHSIVSLAKLYSEQIESVKDGPLKAIIATGAHPLLVIWYGVIPQVLLPFLSFTIYRWDINIRMATVIGLVGGGGIGTLLMQYQGLAKWNEVGLLVLIIALMVWAMDFFSASLRAKIK